MDRIILDSNYGDVIFVSGKCWILEGTTLSAQTGHAPPVSAFSTCEECAGNKFQFVDQSFFEFVDNTFFEFV